MNYRKGDIVRWGYTPEELKRKNHGNNNGTTYWCCSRIAIFDGSLFVDTYWSSDDSTNKAFSVEDIGKTHEITKHVGNFDELDKQSDYAKIEHFENYYKREDIVDISHPNNSRGNLYLRRGAKKDIGVIRDFLQYQKQNIEENLKHGAIKLKNIESTIENLSEDNLDKVYF